MSESNKKRMALPIASDAPVQVDAPKAEASAGKSPEAARAERAADIAVGGKAKAEAKPAFTPDANRIAELKGLSDAELVAKAVAEKGMVATAAGDLRIFQWTGQTTDKLRGQPVDRSKIRSAVVNFLRDRTGFTTEDKSVLQAARASHKAAVHGNDTDGHTIDHVAEGRVIHAFMYLAGPEVHGGKYDIGYVATRRGENKNRGMVARGYLTIIGDATPKAVEAAQVAQEAATEAVAPEVAAQE